MTGTWNGHQLLKSSLLPLGLLAAISACGPTGSDADVTPQSESILHEFTHERLEACPRIFDTRCQTLAATLRGWSEAQARDEHARLIASEALEELDLLAHGVADPEQFESLRRKYALLRHQLETKTAVDDGLPIYHPLETVAVREVFADFGELWLDTTSIPAAADEPVLASLSPESLINSPIVEWSAATQPWASYWYPKRGNALYQGEQSPLAKFDRAMAALGETSQAAAWERSQILDSGADGWEGLCNAWALAATLHPEPIEPVTFGGVVFSPQDQKAILLKFYERYPVKIYGVRYYGTVNTDGTIQDIRPEAFHKLMERFLAQGLPLVMDEDLGVEVWQQPLYRVKWKVRRDVERRNAFIVTAVTWSVRARQNLVDGSTTNDDLSIIQYDYRLFADPASLQDGKVRIVAGEWLASSFGQHPDFFVVPKENGQRSTFNSELEKHKTHADRLLSLP